MKLSFNENSLYFALIIVLLFYIGFNWAYEKNAFPNYQTGVSLDGGDYLRFIYIGSSHCGFANDEDNHHNILKLKELLKELSKESRYSFISTGISVDVNAYQGVRYLKKTGPYDEILSGSNWFNVGVQKYVWERFQGRPSTPQIILTKTKFEVEEFFGIHQSEQVLKRVSGIYEIREMLGKIKTMNKSDFTEWLEI